MPPVPPSPPQLDDKALKGRYGVRYVDTIVSAAGYEWRETGSGADVLAIDGDIFFPEGPVGVQIKTTHKHSISGTNLRLSQTAEQHWVDTWAKAQRPLYFVVVVVPHTATGGPWVKHHTAGTDLLGTAAYWSRIDPTIFAPKNMSVAALRSQRMDATTLLQWQLDLLGGYGG